MHRITKNKKMDKLSTKTSVLTTTQLLQGSSGARAKIWSNYTHDKAYILQHSYSHTSVKLEPKFGSNYTQDKAYQLQHSYSHTSVELEPKFGQIIHKTKPSYYNTATPVLEPKFGQIIHKTKPTYYNTATPILQWS